MSRRTTMLLVGAAGLGVGLLGISSSFAAPASGAVIGEVASAGAVAQKVLWRGRAVGFRGVGWRGVGWRGAGWRTGLGWRPGLAVAGLAAAGLATAATSNYGYGYPYDYYGDGYAGPYAANYGYGYGYGNQPYGYGYQTAGYGYQPTGYGYQSAGYGYQPVVGAAAPAAPAPAAAPVNPNNASYNEPGRYRVRHGQAAADTGPVPGQRWSRAFCVNAVHERLGVSSADAGKAANRDAVSRCMMGGPMAIG